MKKRVLSLVMAFILCLSQLPAEVFAEGTAVNVVTGAENGTEQTGADGSGAENGTEQTGADGSGAESGTEQTVANGSGAESGTEQTRADGDGAESGTEQTVADGDGADSVSNGNSGIAADPESAAGTPMLLAANETDTVNVAEVTVGGTTTQYTDINEAFTAAQEADSAAVTLLSDVTIAEAQKGICLEKGNITFDLNGHTLTGYAGSDYPYDIIFLVTGSKGSDGTPVTAALTLKDSMGNGKIVQPGYIPVIEADEYGRLTVEGGTIGNTSTADRTEILDNSAVSCAILTSGETIIRGGTMSGRHGVVVNGGTLAVTDGTFTGAAGNALIVHDGTAQLSGGTYSNDTSQNEHSIWVMNDGKASSLLAEGYRYETTDGKESGYDNTGSGVKGNTTVKARPAGEFSYIDADGKEAVQTGCKEITADTTELTDGWYAVKGNVTASDPAFVSGTVNLILRDGAEWNLSGELRMGKDATLNIYVQSARTGRLTATGWSENPAIGMGNGMSGGTLNIYGGVITATSRIDAPLPSGEIGVSENRGAAIGTCGESSTGMSVNIYGGTVTAKATYGAQAIGSGQAATGTVNVKIANGMKCVRTDDLNTPAAYANTDGTSVTITECSDHQWEYEHTEGGEKHTSKCKLCGTAGTAEVHDYKEWEANEDADTHTGTCVCGATRTEEHNPALAADEDGLTHASRCDICGHEELAVYHDFDPTTGKCTCGATLAAKYDGKSYASIQSAVDAAKGNNGTVTVQKQQGQHIFEVVTVDSGSVTIDLNGENWCEGTGYGEGVLRINGGSVTLIKGTLLQGGSGNSGGSAVLLESGSLTVEENVKIAGGNRGTSRTYAIEVNGGELTLGKGVTLVLGLKVPDGKKLADYLTAGTAFADEAGAIINGYTTGSTTEDLTVVEHSHTFTKNEEDGGYYCECGYKCPHSFGGNGKCTDCGYACPHEHLSEADGVTTCSDCKAQMVVKVEYTEENGDKQTKYYAQTFDSTNTENTLQTILNDDTITPSGSTITLLGNNLWAFAFVYAGKTVTLNLNGKNLIETGNGIAVDSGSTLKVTGEGTSTGNLDNQEYSYVFNVRGGTLEFADMSFGGTFNGIRVGSGTLISPRELQDSIHIGTLELADAGATVSFKYAAFDKIAFDGTSGSVTLGDLLGVWQDKEGNKVRSGNAFQKADGTLLRYDTEITYANPVENVKTAACHHDSVTGRTCDYCGTENLAAIVVDGGGSIWNYPAKDGSAEAEKTAVDYALYSWNYNGNNRTLKLFVDVTLTADVSLDAGKHPGTGANLKTTRVIDLNGHSFTGTDGTAYGMVVNELVTLTVKDNSAGKKGEFVNVTVNGGGSLIVDGIHVGTITAADSTAKVTLKAGSSFEDYSLPAGMMLADWIEEGCFIYDTGADGDARIPVALTETGAKTAEGKFVVEKAAVNVTAGKTNGEIVYGSGVSTEFCPEVTITDAETYENFGFIKVEWYRRTDSGCKLIGSGTIRDGSYAVNPITPDFDGVKAGDTLEVFCTITAVDNTGDETPFWQTVTTGYKLTVAKGNSSVITAPKATVPMAYKAGATDKKWFLVTEGTAEGGIMVYSLTKDGTYTETIPTAENAGSYTVWYKVLGDENHIDTEPESVTAEIEKAMIKISSFNLKEKSYDGTTDAEVIGVNFQDLSGNQVGSELVPGTDYTVEAGFDDANARSNVSVTVLVTPQDTLQMGNYLLDGKVQGTREIKKAAAPAAAEGTLYILNNRTGTYTFDLSRLLPGLDEGCEFGTVTFSGAQVTMKDGTGFNVTADIDGNLLKLNTLTIGSETGPVGTVTINVVTGNYNDFTLTVKIVSTDKKIVELKEGSTVAVAGSNQLTYGQKLSELTLGSAVFVELDTDTEIKGTLKWSSPDAVPAAGTTTAEWIFVPDEDDLYKEVTGSASIKVEKADPVVTELPTVAEREYDPGRALTAADLTGGAASVDGQWSWKQTGTDIIPTVGNAGYEAVFTPQDTTNYNTVTKTIAVKVTKAAPYIAEKPAAAAITYGKTLADSTLTGGKAAYKDAGGTVIAGSFEWKQGSLKPAVADSNVTEYEVTFIPEDKVNYNTADTKVALTVNKAAVVPNMPGTTMQPAHSTARVKDITLPGGWSWSEDDRDKELEDNVPITAEAVYTGADKDNYETLRVTITITRRDCDHSNRETRNRKDATCTAEGYTGDIYCADCGSFLTAGGKAAPLGHDYKPAVTKEPTVTEEGVETYTCTRCRDSYTVSIPKLPGGNIGERMERDTGNGNNPGAGTEDGGLDGLPEEVPETTPYIRDENGKEGWEVIESRLRDAGEGTAVTVVMNGTAVVPKAIFDSISGKDITIILDMGENISWKINGRDITEAAGDIDLGVKTGAQAGKNIPVDVINQVSGERYSLNLTLSYDGEFGFAAKLSVNMDSENVGLYANLFYYNEQTGELEFVSAGQIGEDGYTELAFTHASDYVIVIDVAVMDGSSEDSDGSGVTEDTDGTGAGEEKTPAADDADGGSAKNVIAIVLAVICILLILAGAVWCYARKKNGSEKE